MVDKGLRLTKWHWTYWGISYYRAVKLSDVCYTGKLEWNSEFVFKFPTRWFKDFD